MAYHQQEDRHSHHLSPDESPDNGEGIESEPPIHFDKHFLVFKSISV